jgi:hypothetical protein
MPLCGVALLKSRKKVRNCPVKIKQSRWINPDRRMRFKCHDKFSKIDPVLASGAMPHNGPAIKCVNVAKSNGGRRVQS